MKKLILNNMLTKSLALLSVLAYFSCSDDLESKDLKVYLSPLNGQDDWEILVNHPALEGKLVMKLPVRSTRELVADANVIATIDESLVAPYNEQHGTEYKLLPATLASITTEVLFAKESNESKDSLGFVCPDVKKLEEPGYILPITLSSLSSSDKGVAISSNLNTVYYVLKVKEYCMYNTDAPIGTLKDRTGWKVTDATNGNEYPTLLDGNYQSGFSGTYTPIITVDMGKVSLINGFRFTPRNSNSFDLEKIVVDISENGQDWTSLRDLVLNTPTAPGVGQKVGYQSVRFYETWSARYVKITTSRTDLKSSFGLSEIDILE